MRTYFISCVVLFLLVACSPQDMGPKAARLSVENVAPREAAKLLEQKNELGIFVLNVHTPYEGHIEGTDAFIEDWENIASHQDVLPLDKSRPLFVYCRSGRMSSSAVEQLKVLGYTNIYHLDGGMRAWKDAGLPLVDKSG